MNADDAAEAIDRIVDGSGTKAYRARKLFDLGCDRSDVVELLGMSYSQAHSIWKADGYDGSNRNAADTRMGEDSASMPVVREDSGADRSVVSSVRQSTSRRGGTIRLSPSQTRYITQDGHVIVRVDKTDGPFCKKCDRHLTFSLRYLGFIHTDSTNEPTDMEDRYD